MAERTEGCAAAAEDWNFCPEALNREELERYGQILDARPASLHGKSVGMALACSLASFH